jgi:hypothetical protein
MSAPLTRDQILSVADINVERIYVAEWGGTVCVRPLTGDQMDEWEELNRRRARSPEGLTLKGLRASLISMCIVDPATGELMFGPSDIEALGKKSGKAVQSIFNICAEICGFTDADIESIKKK